MYRIYKMYITVMSVLSLVCAVGSSLAVSTLHSDSTQMQAPNIMLTSVPYSNGMLYLEQPIPKSETSIAWFGNDLIKATLAITRGSNEAPEDQKDLAHVEEGERLSSEEGEGESFEQRLRCLGFPDGQDSVDEFDERAWEENILGIPDHVSSEAYDAPYHALYWNIIDYVEGRKTFEEFIDQLPDGMIDEFKSKPCADVA